jgi:hypothetical protein
VLIHVLTAFAFVLAAWLFSVYLRAPGFVPAAEGVALAIDSGRHVVVMFGGQAGHDNYFPRSNVTAEWNGANWVRKGSSAAPRPRAYHALASDVTPGRVLLLGGLPDGSEAGPDARPLDDCWLWDGASWAPVDGPLPSARCESAMALDSDRHRVVLFGGRGAGGDLDDTWEWDGRRWTRIATQGAPTPRSGHALAYDATRQRIVLFGGSELGADSTHATWEYDGAHWTDRAAVHTPSCRARSAMAYAPRLRRVVLFGGIDHDALSDTWEWDGTDWKLGKPAESPPPRFGHGLAADPVTGNALMFGGRWTQGDSMWTDLQLADTWEWDGVEWKLHGPPPELPPTVWKP